MRRAVSRATKSSYLTMCNTTRPFSLLFKEHTGIPLTAGISTGKRKIGSLSLNNAVLLLKSIKELG